MQTKQIEIKIKEKLNNIRLFLQKDGGDVEFISFKDGVVYIKITGTCKKCPFLENTFNNEIKRLLIEEIKEVDNVVIV